MDNIFITELNIEKVRNLQNIDIKLGFEDRKHLIFTGKNGSGKTSVLEAMASFLYNTTENKGIRVNEKSLIDYKSYLNNAKTRKDEKDIDHWNKEIERTINILNNYKKGIDIKFNSSLEKIESEYKSGNFITAYYKANREFKADIPRQIEKVEFKDSYSIKDEPRKEFVKYLLDLRATQAFSLTGGKKEKADEIENWFVKFEKLLQDIFDSDSLKLVFDEDTFQFKIKEKDKEVFDFNTLSSGYAAVLDIVVDIILRMEKKTEKRFDFNMQGIVLIDEIETHLHLELQKRILKLLTTIFPKIQFIITTHSPFILNSLENVIIYDLEKKLLVEGGMNNLPYEGIVEGYFKSDTLSEELKKKFEEYKKIVKKSKLTDEDFEKIGELQMYLDEIPDYLALNLNAEYKKLKAELESRADVND